VLSVSLFGRAIPLGEFPTGTLKGIGLSDDWRYADVLATKCDYTNTFYDREPRVDITEPPEEMEGTLDFLIASDVFEHVPPPIDRAFVGACKLLKPGGVLVMTVPYAVDGVTLEYFPRLHDFELVPRNGRVDLINTTVDGERETFTDVLMHGGGGLTVEMRHFALPDLIGRLSSAGFGEVVDWRERQAEFDGGAVDFEALPLTGRRSTAALRAGS
jgi:SAM-dependent methyltransferase